MLFGRNMVNLSNIELFWGETSDGNVSQKGGTSMCSLLVVANDWILIVRT